MQLKTNFYTPFDKKSGERKVVTQITNLDSSFSQPTKVNGRIINVADKAESMARDIAGNKYFSHVLLDDNSKVIASSKAKIFINNLNN